MLFSKGFVWVSTLLREQCTPYLQHPTLSFYHVILTSKWWALIVPSSPKKKLFPPSLCPPTLSRLSCVLGKPWMKKMYFLIRWIRRELVDTIPKQLIKNTFSSSMVSLDSKLECTLLSQPMPSVNLPNFSWHVTLMFSGIMPNSFTRMIFIRYFQMKTLSQCPNKYCKLHSKCQPSKIVYQSSLNKYVLGRLLSHRGTYFLW